ncbi:MAG TPA: EAL domain-containing protein [Candidatus Polarisedimenticolia bacterium]|nr:EAL domain-containing protein [Candidatus Polarisedimenticolia bacterium]
MSDEPTPMEQERPLILLAEDDAPSRMLVKAALEHASFRVEEAENGLQAVEAFARVRPELIILDVMMPVMDGFRACAEIRGLPGGEATPILILTGLDDVASISRAFEVGATDFASKPINWIILSHRVRYMLRASRAFDELRRSEARLAEAQRIARLGNWERDLTTRTMRWSEEMYRIFGMDPGDTAPDYAGYLQRVHPEDRDLAARATDEALRQVHPYNVDLRIVWPDGTVRFVQEQAEILKDPQGRPVSMVGTTQDITERKQAEAQIRFLAYYDGLTLLPNRVLFMERLDLALASARRRGGMLAILFFDLDRFKRINDTLGHGPGDRLLQEVAERLRRCLRSSDTIARGDPLNTNDTVARLGGDEFIVTLQDIKRGEDAATVARRILDALTAPFRLEDQEVVVSASIGISLFPGDGTTAEALLKNADAAMYHAKDLGRSGYQFYDKSMNAAALKRLSLENRLRRALEQQELELHYQPLFDVDAGSIVGAEALIRWRHPDLGLVAPAEFIPLAEETGLILPVGEWVLREACGRMAAWHRAGHRSLVVSVNLSGRQFRDGRLGEVVRRALEVSGLPPRCLELEITESVLMREAQETVATLRSLKALGVRIAVDDFGTGYSSLSYLTRFPIDTLKIDQSFVRDLRNDRGDVAITTAILSMSRGLDLSVIAEGVETQEQMDLLRRQGCRLMQGYFLGRPLPVPEFERLLASRTGGLLSSAG